MSGVVVSLAVFALSVVAAAFLLPTEVDALFWPGAEPDATYPAWLFLLLTVGSFVLYAVVGGPLVRAARALRDSFESVRPGARRLSSGQLAVAMSSVVLTVAVWSAITFPDHHLGVRYTIDTVTVAVVVLGTLAVGARGMQSHSLGDLDED